MARPVRSRWEHQRCLVCQRDLWCQGRPFDACSRNILARVLEKAAAMGYTMNLGMEAEFFVLRDDPVLGYRPVSDRKNLESPLTTSRACSITWPDGRTRFRHE